MPIIIQIGPQTVWHSWWVTFPWHD